MDKKIKEILVGFMKNLYEAFVSEGDFQFALAKELQEKNLSVLVEYPIDDKSIDIVIADKGTISSLIEVKYKTKEDTFSIKGIEHTFKTAGVNRKNFIDDIIKIENLISNSNLKNLKKSYCILLTNNPNYFTSSDYTEYNIDKEIKINNKEYKCEWEDCKSIKSETNETMFKYLIVEIEKN